MSDTLGDGARRDPSIERFGHRWRQLSSLRHPAQSSGRGAARAERVQAKRAAALARDAATSRVLLIRHGEAEHNARWKLHSDTRDTLLTQRGEAQALAISSELLLIEVELLVVSPLSRAIQTAAIVFGTRPSVNIDHLHEAARWWRLPVTSDVCRGSRAAS